MHLAGRISAKNQHSTFGLPAGGQLTLSLGGQQQIHGIVLAASAEKPKKYMEHHEKEEYYAMVHDVILYIHMQAKEGWSDWIGKLRSSLHLAWEGHMQKDLLAMLQIRGLRDRIFHFDSAVLLSSQLNT